MLTRESNSLLLALLLSTFILMPVDARSQDDITSYKLSLNDGSTSTIVVQSRSSDHSQLIVSETTPDTETQDRQVNSGQETEVTAEARAREADAEVAMRVMYLNHRVDYQRRYHQDVPDGLSPVQAQAFLYDSQRPSPLNTFVHSWRTRRMSSPFASSLSSQVLTALSSNPQFTILMLPIPAISFSLANEQWRNELEIRLKRKLLPTYTLANMPWIYVSAVQAGDNGRFTVTGQILLEVEGCWSINRKVPVTAIFVSGQDGSIRMERFVVEGILTVTHTSTEGQLQNVGAMDSLWNEALDYEGTIVRSQEEAAEAGLPTPPENPVATTGLSGSGIDEPVTNEPVTGASENTLVLSLLGVAAATAASQK